MQILGFLAISISIEKFNAQGPKSFVKIVEIIEYFNYES